MNSFLSIRREEIWQLRKIFKDKKIKNLYFLHDRIENNDDCMLVSGLGINSNVFVFELIHSPKNFIRIFLNIRKIFGIYANDSIHFWCNWILCKFFKGDWHRLKLPYKRGNFLPLPFRNRCTSSGIFGHYFFYTIWIPGWRINIPIIIPRLVTLSLRAKYMVKIAKNRSYFDAVQYVEIIVCIFHNIDTLHRS